MKSAKSTRFNMSAAGSYLSIANALGSADAGVRHVIKMGFLTKRPHDSTDPDELEIAFQSDHALLDFKSLVANDLDPRKIIADCDFVKSIALKEPEKLRQLVEAYTNSPTGFEKAAAIADDIGLTEKASIAAGGGMAWLAVLVAIAVMSKACQDAKKGNPQGKPKPEQ